MIDLIEYHFSEIMDGFFDGPHATPEPCGEGPIFLGIKNIKPEGGIDLSEVRHISEDEYPKWTKRVVPQENDLVFSYEATLHRYSLIPNGFRGCLGRRMALIRVKESIVDPVYLYYYFLSPYWKAFVETVKVAGSTVDRISISDFPKYKISLPNLPNQKKIASILSAYDDLIENNNQRIKLLEEMAEEIYKEWFVRFRFPGYQDTKVFDQDGKEVEHGTVGALPEGWEQSTLSKYIDFLEGPGLRNSQFTDFGIRYLNIRVMGQNELFLEKAGYLGSEEVNKRYPHFLLKENDHVVSSSGTIGRVVTIRKSHLPLCLNTSIIRMRPKSVKFGTWQLKQFLKSNIFQGQITSFAIGAAQANFGPTHLKLMKMISPSDSLGTSFEKLVGPMEEEIKILLDKNQILQETRNLLLPRIISGKLNIEELGINKAENLPLAAEPLAEFNL